MIRTTLAVPLLVFGCFVASTVVAEEQGNKSKPVVLKVGDPAPAFQAMSDQGPEGKPILWKSKDRVGKKILVVYFYPADLTGGCTKQACNYRDAVKELKRKDVEIVGVSGDSVENHRIFREHHKLNFTLLADPKGKIAQKFGVRFGEGGDFTPNFKIGGEEVTLTRGVTTSRWTFVVGPDNKILYKDQKVNAVKDTENVLKVIAKIPEIKQKEQ